MNDYEQRGYGKLLDRLRRDERFERRARWLIVTAWVLVGLGAAAWVAFPAIVGAALLGLAGLGLIVAVTLRAATRRFE